MYLWPPPAKCYSIHLKEWNERKFEESRKGYRGIWEFWVKSEKITGLWLQFPHLKHENHHTCLPWLYAKKKKKYQKFLTQCLVLITVNFNIFKKLISFNTMSMFIFPCLASKHGQGAWLATYSPRQSVTTERLSTTTPQNILGGNFVLVFLERTY